GAVRQMRERARPFDPAMVLPEGVGLDDDAPAAGAGAAGTGEPGSADDPGRGTAAGEGSAAAGAPAAAAQDGDLALRADAGAGSTGLQMELESLLGERRRQGDYRVVKVRSGAGLADIAARWCGDRAELPVV